MEPIVRSSLEILDERVSALRQRRRAGAAVSQLVADLRRQRVELQDVTRYFREAFLLSGQANIALIPKLASGEPDPALLDDFIAGLVDAARPRWENAPAYPDLMRRRDRIAFEQVAREHGIVLVVCAADRAAARYIGDPAYAAFPQPFFGVPRRSPPHLGLMAADPDAAELRATLDPADAEGDYARIKARIERHGLTIDSGEGGSLVRDREGRAFFAGYRVHGAYRRETGANAWTGTQGEVIRAELNRRLGADLVLGGPHDTSADRMKLPESHPLHGPQPPVLFFLPDGSVEVRTDARGMELFYRFLGIDWELHYASTLPAPAEESE